MVPLGQTSRTARRTTRKDIMSNRNMKQLVAAVQRGEGADKRSYWTRIGTAFENRDGSYNLCFDYLPAATTTTIQLRDIDSRD